MTSRALRLMLLALFVGLIVGAAYVIWNQESQNNAAVAQARSLDDRIKAVSRGLLDIRSSQPGYVAAGQGNDFWASRIDALFTATREGLTALRGVAHTAQAVADVEAAAKEFEDFTHMDRRAREYVRNSQRLLASDLIFSDGIERIDNALAALERAREAEFVARDLGIHERHRTEIVAAAGAAGLGLLIVFALTPLPREKPTIPPGQISELPLRTESASIGAADTPRQPVATRPPVSSVEPAAPVTAEQKMARAAPPSVPQLPDVDLAGVATLCTELCRVVDTRTIPAALERVASLLDASGIIVWIADPDGRELAPVIAHGYPQNLVNRLGMIPRDAENVTAAAFRTCLVQTVNSDAVSPGAIAAPLVTPSGAVGVMAAEIRHGGERNVATRAVAAIVAAQLATLLGPPAPRDVGKTEAAGA
jgi:PAS domain-containing protein